MAVVTTAIAGIKVSKAIVSALSGNKNAWSDKYGFAPAVIKKIYEDPNYFVTAWKNGYFVTYRSTIPDGMTIGDLFVTYFGIDQYTYVYNNFDNLMDIELKRYSNIQPEKISQINTTATASLLNGNYLIYIVLFLAIGAVFLISKKGK